MQYLRKTSGCFIFFIFFKEMGKTFLMGIALCELFILESHWTFQCLALSMTEYGLSALHWPQVAKVST